MPQCLYATTHPINNESNRNTQLLSYLLAMEENLGASERALQVRVNQLFEKNNVETVRTIHHDTKEEIEEKKKRLRALVG